MSDRRQSNHESFLEIKNLIFSMDGKIDQIHSRVKRVEHVVLGDEEQGIIGLAEKHRVLVAENIAMDRKRAAFFLIIGWLASFTGSYVLRQMLPEKAIAVSVEKDVASKTQ